MTSSVFTLFLSLTGMVLFSGTLTAITPMAKIAYVEGKVHLLRQGQTRPIKAQVGDSLFAGDRVVTKRSSRLQLNWSGTGIQRYASNTFVIVPNPDGSLPAKVGITINGKDISEIEKIAGDEIFEVGIPDIQGGGMEHIRANGPRIVRRWFDSEKSTLEWELKRYKEKGNQTLDDIRAEVAKKIGHPISQLCPKATCRHRGPHYWDGDGWTCPLCHYTVATPGTVSTRLGVYSEEREAMLLHIEKVMKRIEQLQKKSDSFWGR